jgi:hypothetical protein
LRQLVAGALLIWVALLPCCSPLGPTTPFPPAGPDTLGQRLTGRFWFCGQAEKPERVQYICNWGDGDIDTGPAIRSGDTVWLVHAWEDTGSYAVLARALDNSARVSDWSEPKPVLVVNLGPNTPESVLGPDTTFVDTVTEYSVTTQDPEADLVTYEFSWGDGETYIAAGYASAAVCRAVHVWREPGEYRVQARARDASHDFGDWSQARIVTVVNP